MTKMKEIDLSQKITYGKALMLPFRITPGITLLSLADRGIKLISAPLEVIATANFIDAAIEAAKNMSPEHWKIAVLWLACIVLIKVYGYLEEPFFDLMSAKKSQKEWRAIDYPAVGLQAGLQLRHIENSDTNDLISRTAQPSGRLCGIFWNAANLVVFTGRILSYALILVASAPVYGWIILLAAFPMLFLARKSAMAQYQVKQEVTKAERKAWTFHDYLQSRECAAERNLFRYSGFLGEKFRKEFSYYTKRMLRTEVSWGVRRSAGYILLTALCAVEIFLLMPSVTAGAISAGLYISLIRALFSAADSIAFDLSPYLEKITADKEFLKEFNRYLELERMPGALEPMAEKTENFESLVFNHVSFTYPGTEKQVLKDVSFRMEAGRRYSLIGINGSGKSTVVKLILKLYDNYSGEIFLNGISLREWKLPDIKAMIGVVFQDFIRYDISLEDNISAGCGMRGKDDEIDKAIAVSGLSESVSRLPEGKRTLLGKVYDNGQDLSGGQWQKIALARSAISRSTLKIFDEPTAALDPISERDVYREFDGISRGAAAIFISHRLASCVHADRILLLEDGVILEEGTHQELMDKNGRYAEMFESQRGWYL